VLDIQVEVFGVVTTCSVAGGYRRFEGPCITLLDVSKVDSAPVLR